MNRISKEDYYLNIAKAVSLRGTCLRRNYGAVIVKDDEIVSTGYTGNPRGSDNCIDIGTCFRIENNIPSGQNYEVCKSVHAEQNAIISANRHEMIGSTLYLYGEDFKTKKELAVALPCSICERMIINAGIEFFVNKVGVYKVTPKGLFLKRARSWF